MILDQLSIFFDHEEAEASAVSPKISLPPQAGPGGAALAVVVLTGRGGEAAALAVKLQESDDGQVFAETGSFTLEKPDEAGALLTFALPLAVKKKFVRLSYALSGAPEGLKVFAGLTREHFAPYGPGQYIGHGGAGG